ncbi:hypothetical protein PIB30_052280 [Stylosanthes scabra]|uniref:Secreted protein n=1 Tax=Stylosanthes scabra TaxID=79078 RepID=A0ABU6YIL8_9FABA|nr:hypothetical protein [Stylosanthes scabra]
MARHLPRVLPPLQLVPLLGTLANCCSAHVFGRYPRRTPAKSTDTAFRGSSALTSLHYPFLSAQRIVLPFKCGDAVLQKWVFGRASASRNLDLNGFENGFRKQDLQCVVWLENGWNWPREQKLTAIADYQRGACHVGSIGLTSRRTYREKETPRIYEKERMFTIWKISQATVHSMVVGVSPLRRYEFWLSLEN